jgi:Ran GTPase-activating protein (RanGAP) involved in mRNA processing and transport
MLDASDNGMFGYEDMSGITAWAALLKANTSITELNLAKNDINADDAKILAPAISDNGAMTRLNLSNNDIGGEDDEPGVHALADMLRSNTTLKELNISSNNLDKECAQILAPTVGDNGALTKLDIGGNNIEQGEALEQITAICLAKSIELTETGFDEQDTSEYC